MSLSRIHCVAHVRHIDAGETTALFPWKLRLQSSRGAFECTVIYDQLPGDLAVGSRVILDGVLIHRDEAASLVHATRMSLLPIDPILVRFTVSDLARSTGSPSRADSGTLPQSFSISLSLCLHR